MNPDLKALIELQAIDLRILELDNTIRNVPAQIEQLQQSIDQGNQRLADLRKALDEKQKDRRRTEQDVENLRAKLTKYKDQLMTVKTNREYSAMLKEIELCDASIREGEDLILEMMVSTDSLESEIRQVDTAVVKETADSMAKRKELEERIHANQEAIGGLKLKRDSTQKAINPDVLALYRKLSQHHKGIALAEARDECCMGCQVRMRPQFFNNVRKNDSVLTCDCCHRILFWVDPKGADQMPPDKKDQPNQDKSGVSTSA